jgi:hypothetical protein
MCHKIMSDKWWHKNIEIKREINRKAMAIYRKKHPEKIKKLNRKYRKLHGEKYRENSRKRTQLERIKIINHYGGKCECCGISDYRFLCLDHKNNDGYEHRKKVRAGYSLHKWIKDNKYPDSIRVLCFNCNFGRAFYGGKNKICPHKLSEKARSVQD